MNYSELSEKLSQVAARVAKQASKIEGNDLARSARRLEREADRFAEALDSFLSSRKSGELMLETLLRSPSAKRHLTLDLLSRMLREIAGKRMKADDLSAAKREFVEVVHRENCAERSTKRLREQLADASRVASGGKHKIGLQQEFIRLGRLADDEFAGEIGRRTFGELRRLAEANGLRFTDKTSKQRLILMIRRYGQRAALNIPVAA